LLPGKANEGDEAFNTHGGGIRNACGILMENRRNIPFGKPNRRVDKNIKIILNICGRKF
jgi:hypothetical protein